MKKVLSLLLSVALLCSLAAPLVYAADLTVNGYATTETEEQIDGKAAKTYTLDTNLGNPVTIKVKELAILKIVDADPDTEYDWLILDDTNYIYSPFVVEDKDGKIVVVNENVPSDLRRTFGDKQMLGIQGAAVGSVTITIRKVSEDAEGKVVLTPVGSIVINIQKADDEEKIGDQNDLWTILKLYINELKWFWYNDVHPTFKAIYFAVCDWFANLGNTIAGWFQG